MVIGFDRSKKPNFSIKALQIAEEKQAVAQYGSSDSRRVARRHPRRGAEGEGKAATEVSRPVADRSRRCPSTSIQRRHLRFARTLS